MATARSRGTTATADSASIATTPTRTGPYGEAYSLPVGTGRQLASEEGSYFTAVNATIATEITGHAAPAIGDEATKPLVYLYNGGTKFITLDFAWFRTDTPNASSTATYFAVCTAQGGATSRTGGGTAITPTSTRSDSPYATGAVVYFGAVATAPASSKKVGQVMIRPAIAVAEDQYILTFGHEQRLPGYSVSTGTTLADRINGLPPVTIAPGGELMLAMICPSGAATAWDGEISIGWFER